MDNYHQDLPMILCVFFGAGSKQSMGWSSNGPLGLLHNSRFGERRTSASNATTGTQSSENRVAKRNHGARNAAGSRVFCRGFDFSVLFKLDRTLGEALHWRLGVMGDEDVGDDWWCCRIRWTKTTAFSCKTARVISAVPGCCSVVYRCSQCSLGVLQGLVPKCFQRADPISRPKLYIYMVTPPPKIYDIYKYILYTYIYMTILFFYCGVLLNS